MRLRLVRADPAGKSARRRGSFPAVLVALLLTCGSAAARGDASQLREAFWAEPQPAGFRQVRAGVAIRPGELRIALPRGLDTRGLQRLHPTFCVDIEPRTEQRRRIPFITLSSDPEVLRPLPDRMLTGYGGRSCHPLDFGPVALPLAREKRIRFEIVSGKTRRELTLILDMLPIDS